MDTRGNIFSKNLIPQDKGFPMHLHDSSPWGGKSIETQIGEFAGLGYEIVKKTSLPTVTVHAEGAVYPKVKKVKVMLRKVKVIA